MSHLDVTHPDVSGVGDGHGVGDYLTRLGKVVRVGVDGGSHLVVMNKDHQRMIGQDTTTFEKHQLLKKGGVLQAFNFKTFGWCRSEVKSDTL